MLVCTSCTGHSDCKITTKQVDTASQQFGMNTNDADIAIYCKHSLQRMQHRMQHVAEKKISTCSWMRGNDTVSPEAGDYDCKHFETT